MEAIHAAQALVRLTPRFPEHEQRGHLIGMRRLFTRSLMEQFIGFAMRATEEQARVGEILHNAGPEGVELMVDQVRMAEAVGPRRFVHDVLATTPSALPMLLPLLGSAKWHEVRHSAELLGRLGLPEAIEPLRQVANHSDERVRKAVLEALGRFDSHAVIEPLRRGLADPAPVARVSAAHALSQRNSPGLALPILVALEAEKDPATWDAMVEALARIDSNEAVSALVGIALDKRPIFSAGRPRSQRLEVVNALQKAKTATARRGLERIAVEADGAVRRAAAAAVDALTADEPLRSPRAD
jgi:HEAT repeat protein